MPPCLRIDAVKSLQQRWQAEAQSVPLDRKQEQKLWDAFRKPIDDAFNRKTQEREKAAAALSSRDRAVLEASRAWRKATASGDAQKIRTAMAALEQALRARDDAAAAAPAAANPETAVPVAAASDAVPGEDAQSEGPGKRGRRNRNGTFAGAASGRPETGAQARGGHAGRRRPPRRPAA
jgi:hypothetical protein